MVPTKIRPSKKLAEEAKRIGYKSVELLTPDKFKLIQPFGLTCAMLSGACTIPDGFNEKKRHDQLEKSTREHIDFAAENGSAQRDCLLGAIAASLPMRKALRIAPKASSASSVTPSRKK